MKRTTFVGWTPFLEKFIAAVLVLGVLAVVAFIAYPIFVPAKIIDYPPTCLSQAKQLALSTLMYAYDFDERMPDRDRWMDVTYEYRKNRVIEHCPALQRHDGEKTDDSIYGYAFNSRLHQFDSSKISQPERVPLIYDSTNLARNASDPFVSLPDPGRHKGKDAVSYLDGHAKWVMPPGN